MKKRRMTILRLVTAVLLVTPVLMAQWSVRPGPNVGSSPRAGVGGLINRLSTKFGYTLAGTKR